MRRILALSFMLLIACRAFSPFAGSPSPQALEGYRLPESTFVPPAFLAPPRARVAPQVSQLSSDDFKVVAHPDGILYVGDQVSLEVIASQESDLSGYAVQLDAPGLHGLQTRTENFWPYGIGNRLQANFLWAWDTAGLEDGAQSATFTILPDGPSWTEMFLLHSQDELALSEKMASWDVAESDCCRIHFITGTRAERDLEALMQVVDRQMDSAVQKMGYEPVERLEITFLPRVLGHGGFARENLSVSYLDRSYAGEGINTVLHHELIHALDAELAASAGDETGSGLRPAILIEGLAVYLTGGHFKPEPLAQRAAALLPPREGCARESNQACGLDWYIPLSRLADNFYLEQHEIGYLQAGALVEFLVETWGWEAFVEFYRDIHPGEDQGATPYQLIDHATQVHFDLSLAEVEARFLEALAQETLSYGWVEDVRLSVAFYDSVRQYQILLDPSAYFLSVWLPDNAEMRSRGIVADYLRRPVKAENLAIENMLARSDAHIREGEYEQAALLLEAVDVVLDLYPREGLLAFSAHPLAAEYLALVQAALSDGYQPQRIWIDEQTARIWVVKQGTSASEFKELNAIKQGEDWLLSPITGS